MTEMVALTSELVDSVLLARSLAAANGSIPETHTLPLISAADLCAEPDNDTGQLLGPLILAGGRTIIVGDTGHGKTSLAFQLIRSTLDGDTFLDWTGHGQGRALIVDLEQGRRSVKRGLRDAGLAHRTDVDLILIPDGLSLDRNPDELAQLDQAIAAGQYTLVDLDPYYKAHRADEPNAERPIVDLMRTLDQLRAKHGFALILPAHPRKDLVGAPAVRKLTIHDIAGSGAVTRGAEIVLGIERVSHGTARLRYLKDREGDLPIGEAWNLHYTKTDGYRRDPADLEQPRDLLLEITTWIKDHPGSTTNQVADGISAGRSKILETLKAADEFSFTTGKNRARFWWFQTVENHPEPLELPDTSQVVLRSAPLKGAQAENHLKSGGSENDEQPPPIDDATADAIAQTLEQEAAATQTS